ncbi:MAG: YggS family pyridoxal phosphate-dependent enzyme [Alphaproteobacteria bacterium]|nr:YggS family pyridoxal phosphate-dependent enzyme [Alphaproteobacteria bacterium]
MSIALRLAALRPKLGQATLIAVSKTHPLESVREALNAGQRVFGENRVQEALKKFVPLRQDFDDIELHLIGPLQTNKAQTAVELFDVIQTLDRPALAEALAKASAKSGKRPRLYIEVNIGQEPQKAGVGPDETEAFLSLCRNTYALSVSGLMCIPPLGKEPRSYFEALKALANHLALSHISMGMSADFETAIACGATEVRLGTALFGHRSPRA